MTCCAEQRGAAAAGWAQLPLLVLTLAECLAHNTKPASRRRLGDSGLGQLRGTGVDGGRGVLLEVADAEAVPVRLCWPGCKGQGSGLAVEAGLRRRWGKGCMTWLCLGCAALAICSVVPASVHPPTGRQLPSPLPSPLQGALDVLRQAFPTWTVQEYTAFAAYRKQQRSAAEAAAAEERAAAAARRSNKRPRVEAEAAGGARASGGSDSEGWMSRCRVM